MSGSDDKGRQGNPPEYFTVKFSKEALQLSALAEFKKASDLSGDAGVEEVVQAVRDLYQYVDDVQAGKRPKPGPGFEVL